MASRPEPPPSGQQLGWIPAGALAGALLAVADVVLAPRGETLLSIATAAGLGITVGGSVGVALHAVERGVRRLPRRAVVGLPVVGALLGLYVAMQLGAFARLGGPYHALAMGLLVASVLGGGCIGLTAMLQLDPPASVGTRLSSRRGRLAFGAAFALVAIVLVFVDRTYFLARYPLGHDALGTGALWFLLCAVRACPPLPASPRPRRATAAAALAFVMLAAVVLDARGQDALRARYLARGTRSWMLRGVRFVTDLDRDGYSSLFGGGDCAPLTSAIHPGAIEVPGNGTDDNCLLGDARAQPPRGRPEVARPDAPSPRNVVLVTVDTWRFDRTSFERPDLDTTPHLRAWADRALRFDRAYSAGGLTAIAVPAMMRGIYPRRLAWTQLADTSDFQLLRLSEAKDLPPYKIRVRFGLPLEDPSWSLPRYLSWRGMQTAAVVDDGWISDMFAPRFFAEGFDTFVDVDTLSGASPNDDARAIDEAIAQLQRLQATGAPYFLWVHLFGLHGPNPDRPDIPRRSADAWGEYDQAMTYFDRHLERLLVALEPSAGQTVFVLTADHGEHITGRDRFHGTDLLETSIRVPLLIRVPGGRTGVDHTPVSTLDLFPTLLSLTGTPVPDPLDGVDLTALVTTGQPLPPRILLADTWRIDRWGKLLNDVAAAFDGERKYVFDRLAQTRSLVDQRELGDDPPNLIDDESAGALRDALLRYLEETNGPVFVEH